VYNALRNINVKSSTRHYDRDPPDQIHNVVARPDTFKFNVKAINVRSETTNSINDTGLSSIAVNSFSKEHRFNEIYKN
jgi:hypothetical protein